MTFTALLILEGNLAFANTANFSTMARQTLGRPGQAIIWLAYLTLLYALTAAYMSGGTSLFEAAMTTLGYPNIPASLGALLFTIILGGVVFIGARIVDYLNRGLMFLKAFAFILILFVLMPHINSQFLTSHLSQLPYSWVALPIVMVAFGSHFIIPSIRIYIGDEPKTLRNIILIGSLIPLIVYLVWEAITLGILPLTGTTSFQAIAAKHGSVGDMVIALQSLTDSKLISFGFNFFTDVAITTSFLGVTLSLFDFIGDAFKLNNQYSSGRIIAALITYLPPLAFALFYPKGFVMALGYASISAAVLVLIFPAVMVAVVRCSPRLHSSYRVFSGNIGLIIAALAGILIITLEILNNMQLLPKLM
ncbi:amino acid permease [Piscirickettsia litoralis]|uniref:amino acid permease n=1 Tax=Piscirickettsia litoralis TaxID=1891921 RepID=UPI000B0E93D9|nr:aromatic amino acid transport family protein [Piscirickettsia litoralis]